MLPDKRCLLVAICHYIVLSTCVTYGESLNSSSCKEAGFSSSTLLCSSCAELKQFKLGSLEKTCRQCCIADGEDEESDNAKSYARAVLEVCS